FSFLILGCGWIGEAFAKKMQKLGHPVYATTTQEHKCQRLRAEGIYAFVLDLDEPILAKDFPKSIDFVLTSVPAVRRLDSDTIQDRFDQLVGILDLIEFNKQIFLSSVGVYPDISGDFDESFVLSKPSNLICAEHIMLKDSRTVVYRLGGLFGANRIFAKYFQGKHCVSGGERANFIHQDDVIELIYLGFIRGLNENLYNIVCPEHPLKKEVIIESAKKYNF